MAMLITIAEAAAFCGASAYDDDTLSAFISAAQEAMENHCQRSLEETSVTEQVDGRGLCRLFTREPFQALTSVHVDATRAFGAGTLVASSDYRTLRRRDGTAKCVERLDNVWERGQKNIRLLYQAGYTAATMPADVKLACQMQVAKLYSEYQRARAGQNVLASQSVDGWTINWIEKNGLDGDAVALLRPYVNEGI